MKDLLRLLALLKPHAGWMLLGVLASLLTLLANVALMATSGWLIAAMALAGAAGVSMNYVTPAATIRAMAILRSGGRYVDRLVTHEATFRLLANLRVWLYHHLEPLAPAGLETYRSGDLLSRIRADIDTLDNLYIKALAPVSVALMSMTLLTLVMAGYDRGLALILFGFLLAAGVALPLWTGRLGRHPGQRIVETSAALRTAVVDAVQGMAELTVCGAGEAKAQEISETSRDLIQAQRKMSRISGFSQAGMLLAANLGLWAVVVAAVSLVAGGTIEKQDLSMLALFTLAAFESVMPLPDALRVLGQTLTAARRLFSILDRKPPLSEPQRGREQPEAFHLKFESVDFRYSTENPPALQGIDLELRPGRKLAVVGPTGSGKSSLIQLLLRFREPDSGRITLGGQPLGAYRGEDLRDWIAVVPQQVHLFNASIRDNLKIADPDADQQPLEEACRIAHIQDFIISQPDGYDTWVGETGIKLSGGQARRIAIARALVRDCRLLILDEPGEGLDSVTEQSLIDALIDQLGERSLLLITHHRIGLNRMDEIAVFENGQLLEQGSYEALSATNGRFSKLMQPSFT
jgi:ATP-binding cassette subfamily C protein CydC